MFCALLVCRVFDGWWSSVISDLNLLFTDEMTSISVRLTHRAIATWVLETCLSWISSSLFHRRCCDDFVCVSSLCMCGFETNIGCIVMHTFTQCNLNNYLSHTLSIICIDSYILLCRPLDGQGSADPAFDWIR